LAIRVHLAQGHPPSLTESTWMKGAAGVVSLCLAMACVAAFTASPAGADPPAIDPNTACATNFSALRIDGDPNAVVVVADDLAGTFSGTVTAYGHQTKWTGTIGRAAVTEYEAYSEASLIVRADGPIEGVEYTPTWASCTFHAGTRPRGGYDDHRDIQRPVLVVTSPVAIEPVTCTVPFRSTGVVHAPEPIAPQSRVSGFVRVAVALDDQGIPRFTRVVSSQAAVLNTPSVNAARQSTYTATVFRCQPVPGGYEFAVMFSGN